MKFYRYHPSAPAPETPEYPCIVLRDENWDDYGYQTTFEFRYYSAPKQYDLVGRVRILKRGFKKTNPPASFDTLDVDYCSVGFSIEYYQKLLSLGLDVYSQVLVALRDAIYRPEIDAAFQDDEGFETSLLRYWHDLKIEIAQAVLRQTEVDDLRKRELFNSVPIDTEEALQRLSLYRKTLNLMYRDLASTVSLHGPIEAMPLTQETRRMIREVKVALRAQGITVEDLPIDEDVSIVGVGERVMNQDTSAPSANNTTASAAAPVGANPSASSQRPLRVFLCHSSGDKIAIRDLYHRLQSDGFVPWLDEEDLLAGQDWQEEIRRTVQQTEVVLVCLSRGSLTRAGFLKNEMKYVLDEADKRSKGTVFLIPVRLEECNVPTQFRKWHWIDLYQSNGYERLVKSLNARANTVGVSEGSVSTIPTSDTGITQRTTGQEPPKVTWRPWGDYPPYVLFSALVGLVSFIAAVIAIYTFFTGRSSFFDSTAPMGTTTTVADEGHLANQATQPPQTSATTAGTADVTLDQIAGRNNKYSSPPEMTIDRNKNYTATIKMPRGDIVIKLRPDLAPETVNNFVFLANEGFYDGVTWHRVLEGFMAQTGDPTGTGGGGPGYTITDEFSPDVPFDKPGIVAMARTGEPNSGGSQFFITTAPAPHLNGGYTIFGEVTSGQDIVDAIPLRDPDENPSTLGEQILKVTVSEQ